MEELLKRKWHFAQHPAKFDISCSCGESMNTTWSEYVGHLWCFECEKDIPIKYSILHGPIPATVAEAMGISFDRINIKTGKLEKFNSRTGKYGLDRT